MRPKCCVTNSPLLPLQKGLKAWAEARSLKEDVRQLLLLEIKYGEHVRTVFLFEHHTKMHCFQPTSREMVFHHSSSDHSTVHYTGETWQPHFTLDKTAILSPLLVSAVQRCFRWWLMDLHTKQACADEEILSVQESNSRWESQILSLLNMQVVILQIFKNL